MTRTEDEGSKCRKQATDPSGLSLYYASDIHGSELCWRKFLGAAKAYGVEALIMPQP